MSRKKVPITCNCHPYVGASTNCPHHPHKCMAVHKRDGICGICGRPIRK